MKKLLIAAVLLASTAANAETVKTNDPAELKKIIAEQKKEIAELNAKLANVEPAAGAKPEMEPASIANNKLVKNKFEYNKE